MLSGRLEHVLNGHTGRLNAVRISPNSKTAITVADDFTARVFDLQSGDCRSVSLIRSMPRFGLLGTPCRIYWLKT